MPKKSKKPCKHPGCPNLTDGKYCEEHKHLHPDRPSAESRGSTVDGVNCHSNTSASIQCVCIAYSKADMSLQR